MPNTKTLALSSIDTNTLSDVNGGCGGRRCHHHRSRVVNIVNNYAAPAAAPAPAAPAPSSNWAVNVSAGYQQA